MGMGSSGRGQEAGSPYGSGATPPDTANNPGAHRGDPVPGVPRQAAADAPRREPDPPRHEPEAPPMPAAAPHAGPPLGEWLRMPRPEAEPGIWRCGYEPLPAPDPDRIPTRQLVSGALVSFFVGWLLWSLLWNGYLGDYWMWPYDALMPEAWSTEFRKLVYNGLVLVVIGVVFGRLGRWQEVWRRATRPARSSAASSSGSPPPAPRRADGREYSNRRLAARAVGFLLLGWMVWSLLWQGFVGDFWIWPLLAFTPDDWRQGGYEETYALATYAYYALVIALLARVCWRWGHWGEAWRRLRRRFGAEHGRVENTPAPPLPGEDPAAWPQLRGGGAPEAAERLAAELSAGRMTDVDHARIERAWQSVRARPGRLPAFTDAVLRDGAGACVHPSGSRDLPLRAARHDLSLRQVRVGTGADDARNPHPYRGAGIALDPALLGTSVLAVGPAGSGKTSRLVRPAVESLCLQALAGQAAVVAVTTSGARPAPDAAFDVVVRPGRRESAYDLDLYGGSEDPDEAAGMLAEALVGDLAATLPGGDSRRAATALAQLLGPFQAVHGRFPTVPELRELLDGAPSATGELREALQAADHRAQLRELDAFERQSGRPGDTAALLADRIALLDRPAFADFFVPRGAATTDADGHRPFSLRALEHPLRVRIDLPERGHAEASRILARLVLAQFADCALAREDQSLFACLVLDDAAQTVTPQSLRALQRLRSGHAGVLLTLSALDDVPEPLRGPLLGAVGCRMVCAGVTPWDAEHFAEVWGTEWVQTRDVTNRQLVSDEPFTRMMHGLRKLATGRHVTAESVTVRTVQRKRWSASDLANELPAGHAVLSLTTVRGRRTPPVLARLEE